MIPSSVCTKCRTERATSTPAMMVVEKSSQILFRDAQYVFFLIFFSLSDNYAISWRSPWFSTVEKDL